MIDKFRKFLKENRLVKKRDKLLVLFSNGNDSAFLLRMLLLIKNEYELDIKAILIRYPKHIYKEFNISKTFWKGVEIIEVTPEENDQMLNVDVPCTICKLVRRKYIEDYTMQFRNYKIVTGHTLSDLIAYLFVLLVRSGFNLKSLKPDKYTIEILARFYSYLNYKGAEVIRPLLNFSENEILSYNIGISKPNQCKYKLRRPKRHIFEVLKLLKSEVNYYSLMRFLSKYGLPKKFEKEIIKYGMISSLV